MVKTLYARISEDIHKNAKITAAQMGLSLIEFTELSFTKTILEFKNEQEKIASEEATSE